MEQLYTIDEIEQAFKLWEQEYRDNPKVFNSNDTNVNECAKELTQTLIEFIRRNNKKK